MVATGSEIESQRSTKSLVEKSTITKNESTITKSTTSAVEVPAVAGSADDRGGFGNGIEFVLTCLGLSVGLGNIWRFPTRAYENGGSAFLIPYLTCAILFGLPAIYIEFLAGQYQGVSPPIVFRRIAPILEGVGWMSTIVSACVSIYYIVIVSWVCIYIVNVFRGDINFWNRCDNPWNNPATCIEMMNQKLCKSDQPPGWNISVGSLPENMIYFNGTCRDVQEFVGISFVSGTEQYMMKNVINHSTGLLDINHINWPILGAMAFCWFVTAMLILNGMKIMGKISYVTVILPYVLVIILFFRGITLDGASDGLYYYFGNPDYGKLLMAKTWTEALKQLCFSLSVGHGGLMSMASYSKKSNNCFKDALIIIVGDTMMSLIGGAAVFSTLGFLAKQRNVAVPEVVESGLSLAFVVYPEAMTQMPVSWLWAFLFFTMLFLLGISSEIAYVEVFCTCLYDQKKELRKKRWLVVGGWCTLLFLAGVIFSTDAGLYWFQLFDEYAAGFSSVCAVTIEVIAIAYIYGHRNFKMDIFEMIKFPKLKIFEYIGAHSPYFLLNWRFILPPIGCVLIALSFDRDYPFMGNATIYPPIFDFLGWMLAFLPLLMIPIFAVRNVLYFKKNQFDKAGLFVLQKQHVSFPRISQKYTTKKLELVGKLPDFEPWTNSSKDTPLLSEKSEKSQKSEKSSKK
ncbi:unnamed protein product [Caenorhabditis angaria]|uniref:Uncharacterized protein n=1 Tax=Caenorhabditis angaria TaxID=860376 RepID=A0A9P1MX49_9PELO|nr:unnamed protein product [Caenorhabditis angaria]